jgi:hypothetical protein
MLGGGPSPKLSLVLASLTITICFYRIKVIIASCLIHWAILFQSLNILCALFCQQVFFSHKVTREGLQMHKTNKNL